jgi:hypothetical protein
MPDEDEYEVPLQDQRLFGAGIKRQRVKFVPSSSACSTDPAVSAESVKSISGLYLSMVLPKDAPSSENSVLLSLPSPTPSAFAEEVLPSTNETSDPQMCEICKLPLSTSDEKVNPPFQDNFSPSADLQTQLPRRKPRPHEASIAHQVCIMHSHPPSHLDRSRKGLAYLSVYGWDPDSRKGLGVEGQGIKFPIKAKPKDDRLGIGAVLPKPGDFKKKEKPQKLDAGKIRKLQERDKRKGEKLRELFYRSEDVERYLGGG